MHAYTLHKTVIITFAHTTQTRCQRASAYPQPSPSTLPHSHNSLSRQLLTFDGRDLALKNQAHSCRAPNRPSHWSGPARRTFPGGRWPGTHATGRPHRPHRPTCDRATTSCTSEHTLLRLRQRDAHRRKKRKETQVKNLPICVRARFALASRRRRPATDKCASSQRNWRRRDMHVRRRRCIVNISFKRHT